MAAKAPDGYQFPWYPFYPGDWERDEYVELLSYEERGVFHHLLNRQWEEGSIPADLDTLQRLVRPQSSMSVLWERLSRFFVPVEGREDRLQNRRLEEIQTADESS